LGNDVDARHDSDPPLEQHRPARRALGACIGCSCSAAASARAVARFKRDELGVPPEEIVDAPESRHGISRRSVTASSWPGTTTAVVRFFVPSDDGNTERYSTDADERMAGDDLGIAFDSDSVVGSAVSATPATT